MPTRSGRGFVLPMPEPDTDEEESKEEEETNVSEVTVEEPTPLPDILAALRAKTGKTFATFTTYVIVIVFVRSFSPFRRRASRRAKRIVLKRDFFSLKELKSMYEDHGGKTVGNSTIELALSFLVIVK